MPARIYALPTLLLLASLLARAQNPAVSSYPANPETDIGLTVLSNRPAVQRTLNGGISSGATTIVLSSGAGLLAPVLISIDSEIFNCTTLSTNTLSGCAGGQEGTSTAAHSNGANVFQYITAGYMNRITAAIKAEQVKAAKRDIDYIAGGGTAQAQTVTLVPPEVALVDGFGVCWKPAASNTAAAPSLAVNGLTATTITKLGATALAANDIVINVVACARYNSTGPRFELQNPQTSSASGSTNNDHTISTSTTPVFDRLAPNQQWEFTISTSNSTATATGLIAADEYTFNIKQCATTGGCNFTWPSGFPGCTIANNDAFTGTANLTITQVFSYDGTTVRAKGGCSTDAAVPGAGFVRGESPTPVELSGAVSTSGNGTTVMNVLYRRRVCDIAIGDTSGSALTNAQLGPQKRICYIPAAATIVELYVAADAGTPNVIVGRNTAGTIVNITSAALATAASGGIACSNTGGTTGIDGATTCSATLQNTALAAGAYLELVSGTAGGTAKWMTAHIIYTVN